jgi:transcription elongation factor Elf1
MDNDAAHPHLIPVVACMICGHYMPVSAALGKSTTGSSVIYYMECSRCGQQFKSSGDDVVLNIGRTSHIEDKRMMWHKASRDSPPFS